MGGEEDYESFSGNDDNGLTSLRYGRLDRLSSCLFLMACVITRARLDSIVVPESVHNHRDAIPPEAKGPCLRSAFQGMHHSSLDPLSR